MATATYDEMVARANMLDPHYKDRITKGMAVLQARFPDSWAERIDCLLLDLSCQDHCVLGQVYADVTIKHPHYDENSGDGFGKGLIDLKTIDPHVNSLPGDYGFMCDDDVSYGCLDAAWGFTLGCPNVDQQYLSEVMAESPEPDAETVAPELSIIGTDMTPDGDPPDRPSDPEPETPPGQIKETFPYGKPDPEEAVPPAGPTDDQITREDS